MVASVFGDDLCAWIGHPVCVEMFLDEGEECGLDVDAGKLVDGIHEKAAGGLSGADTYDEYAFGIGVQEHGHMSSHDLMGFFIAALPPFVKFKFKISIALNDGHVCTVSFLIVDKVAAFADEVCGDLSFEIIRDA